MKEKANPDIAFGVTDLLAQKLRQEHQMIIMNPNVVVISDVRCDLFGKQSVNRFICNRGCIVWYHFVLEIVQYRPQNLICDIILVHYNVR